METLEANYLFFLARLLNSTCYDPSFWARTLAVQRMIKLGYTYSQLAEMLKVNEWDIHQMNNMRGWSEYAN